MDLRHWADRGITAMQRWQDGFGEFEPHPSLRISDERFGQVFTEFTERLAGNYPFFHPRYAGQMLKPPHPAAIAAYLTAMLINPNNHALDGGPATARMEQEAVAQLAEMFGLRSHLGHLTTSGTIANLEALFVARESHPGRGVAASADAHYTHRRMCQLLGIEHVAVATDAAGRMDPGALQDVLRTGRVGTVVATAGSTGLGAVDPVHEIMQLARRHGARVHVDAAYGGFFTLLAAGRARSGARAGSGEQAGPEPGTLLDSAPWRAIADCDSVVVDPHKHGLQPYGCGAVLFRDPAVGRFYVHHSPYTYFTSGDLHLGEISLECSRAGAAAAALWLTLRLFPLRRDGLGAVLAAGRRAALRWADLLRASPHLVLYQQPELDIVCYFPAGQAGLSAIDRASARMLSAGMSSGSDPVFLSTLNVQAAEFARRHPAIPADAGQGRILRSVLLKPESESYLADLHSRVERLAQAAAQSGAVTTNVHRVG